MLSGIKKQFFLAAQKTAKVDVYVAGFRFSNILPNDTTLDLAALLNSQLDQIHQEAVSVLGKNVLVVLVLHEYGFTPKTIEAAEKKLCYKKLKSAVSRFKNFILIPGTIAYTKTTKNKKKFKKIHACYRVRGQQIAFSKDNNFQDEALTYYEANATNPKSLSLIQNSVKIMTELAEYKYRKSFPFFECERRAHPENNYIFDIGNDKPVVDIQTSHHSFNMGIMICREIVNTTICKEVAAANPLLVVIISASINNHLPSLLGALNIHMDKANNLFVCSMADHPKAHLIGQVKAQLYIFDCSRDTLTKTPVLPIELNHYSQKNRR